MERKCKNRKNDVKKENIQNIHQNQHPPITTNHITIIMSIYKSLRGYKTMKGTAIITSPNMSTETIRFTEANTVPELYTKISKTKNVPLKQNDDVVSFLKCWFDTDENGRIITQVLYTKTKYELFLKTLAYIKETNVIMLNSKDMYEYPNAMGLAFYVISSDGMIILSKRDKNRRVRPSELDCSIVEGLKTSSTRKDGTEYTITSSDHVYQEILRGFREEICQDDTNLEIRICGIVFDKEYGQWNITGYIKTPITSKDIIKAHDERVDTSEENSLEELPLVGKNFHENTKTIYKKLKSSWNMATTVFSLVESTLRQN